MTLLPQERRLLYDVAQLLDRGVASRVGLLAVPGVDPRLSPVAAERLRLGLARAAAETLVRAGGFGPRWLESVALRFGARLLPALVRLAAGQRVAAVGSWTAGDELILLRVAERSEGPCGVLHAAGLAALALHDREDAPTRIAPLGPNDAAAMDAVLLAAAPTLARAFHRSHVALLRATDEEQVGRIAARRAAAANALIERAGRRSRYDLLAPLFETWGRTLSEPGVAERVARKLDRLGGEGLARRARLYAAARPAWSWVERLRALHRTAVAAAYWDEGYDALQAVKRGMRRAPELARTGAERLLASLSLDIGAPPPEPKTQTQTQSHHLEVP